MTRPVEDSNAMRGALELLVENGFEGMASALEILLNEAMKLERAEFIGAGPYERNSDRRGYSNGYKPKKVNTRLGRLDLKIPQVRGLEDGDERFYPQAIERGTRSERALKLAVAEMYVQGVSTRKVADITRELCGLEVSSTQVSRAAKLLDEELQAWRERDLGEVPYLMLDARYEKTRHGGSVVDCAVFIAVGVTPDGKRTVLGVSVALSEAEVHWREFLASLQARGIHGMQLITSDKHSGLTAALSARFPGVPWQRCQFHLQQNAAAYAPRQDMRKEIARDLRTVFDAANEHEAGRLIKQLVEKYAESAPRLADWIENNVYEGLTVFQLPPAHRRRLRTTNMLERLNREVKRRTAVASLFPNEESLLRLVSAVLIEQSEDWETGRTYLNMVQD